jgi:ribbon-helix-helix CopG family protein
MKTKRDEQVCLRLAWPLRRRVEEEARQEGVSLGEVIRQALIDRYVARAAADEQEKAA